MKAILLPLILLALGLGAGAGAALFLAPAEEAEGQAAPHQAPDAVPADALASPCGPAAGSASLLPPEGLALAGAESVAPPGRDYLRLNNQFVVPVVAEGQVTAMVILSLSLEVPAGQQDAALQLEPRLRDHLLQAMFDHANTGGFDGMFTAGANLRNLRAGLRAAARNAVGDLVSDVLIVELARQDL